MKVGDLVKGVENSPYLVTNEKMKKGVVVSVFSSEIEVKILQHENGNRGVFRALPKYFEVIGELKVFNRAELLERLADGENDAIFEYDLRRADLRRADLSEADLSEANLGGADLSGADLSEANLRRANLSGADLGGADLSGADLGGANLSEANLSEANLGGANLSEANLSEANLGGANLRRADLSEANLRRANLSGANLRRANLSGADLRRANLSGADLDFSCLPLWCGSLLANLDDRQVKQLLYHTLSVVKHSNNVSQELKEKLLTDSNLAVAKEFHRARECERL